jgi:N-acetylglutamate synthase-like GNAT family acetyltransferase
MSYMGKSKDNEANIVRSHINKAENRLSFIATTLKTLYEDRVAGDITIDEYKRQKADYDREKALIVEQLEHLKRELNQFNVIEDDIEQWLDLVTSCVDLEVLDRETVTGLIEKIVVGEIVEVDGKKTREIEISYRFIGSLLSNAKEDAASQANVLYGAIV